MTREEAEEVIREFIRQEYSDALINNPTEYTQPEVYSIDANLETNAVINTISGPLGLGQVESPINDPEDTPEWPFFIDDMPDANFEHPCRYAVVHKSGAVSTVNETAPPSTAQNFAIFPVEIFPEDETPRR